MPKKGKSGKRLIYSIYSIKKLSLDHKSYTTHRILRCISQSVMDVHTVKYHQILQQSAIQHRLEVFFLVDGAVHVRMLLR